MLKKILVPLDGSELGEMALVYAKELAGAINLEVQMACATERQDEATHRMCGLYLEKVAERLRTQIKRINSESDVKTVVVDGEPATALVEYAEKEGIDLIIMMSHGRSGIMRWAIGGTASKVVQRCRIPVLLIRASQALSKRRPVQVFKKILLPLDGSAMGEAALTYVKPIVKVLNCEVILFRVVEIVQRVHTIGGLDHFVYSEQQIERMKDEALKYLEKACQQFDKGNVNIILGVGDPAHEIIKLSDEENINLVAMSSHGKSGMTRWVMGSVFSKILQAGETPLLLVRPK
ncbi:MAG TPA: universal stress protein [Dehalococcoidales bacterium]